MSWLKLTSKSFFLMEGGTDRYIDKVDVHLFPDNNAGFNHFPAEWFRSKRQRPQTLIVDLENDNTVQSFSNINFLKFFEIPISQLSYQYLKQSQSIAEVFDRFKELVGVGDFSEDFYRYKNDYLIQPASCDFPARAKIKKTLDFPPINYPIGAGVSWKEPTFAYIFLWLARKENLSVRPYLIDYSSNPTTDSQIRVMLNFIDQPSPSLAQPVNLDLETLENALIPKTYNIGKENPHLFEVLDFLQQDRGIAVNADNDLKDRKANIKLQGDVAFTQIMDTISSTLDLNWDWRGKNAAFLFQNN